MDSKEGLILAAIVVVLLVLVFVVARSGRARWALGVAGAAAAGAVTWAALSAGGGSRAAATGGAARIGGADPGAVELIPFRGALLTPAEAAVIEAEGPTRQPRPPQTVAELSDTLPYREGALQRFSRAIHLGQRKLLLTEIDFLTEFYGQECTVVYVGAGPGIHIPFLASLFPSFRFELHDPTPFQLKLSRYYRDPGVRDRITTREAFFTDDDARALAGRPNILFMSDIRTGVDSDAATLAVPTNMEDQQRWYELAAPTAGFLKFRLPWTDGTTEYLEGEIRLQPWAPLHSTETRLLVRGPAKRIAYDNRDYERRMYYEYSIVRQWLSFEGPHFHGKVPGLDMCFDCQLEVAIWDRYIQRRDGFKKRGSKKRGKANPLRIIPDFMNETTRELRQSLVASPHGERPRELIYDSREDLLRECLAGRGPCVPNADRYQRREERHARMRKKAMAAAN